MKFGRRLSLSLLVITLFASSAFAAPGALRAPTPSEAAQAEKALQESPLLFERNDGQYANGFDFVSRTPGRTFLIHPWGALVDLRSSGGGRQQNAKLALRFTGSRPDARPVQTAAATGIINYYTGHDRTKWRSGISSYERLRYSGVYDGIDVEYYGHGDQLEYDLIVAPGADPRQIGLSFDGARNVCVNPDGTLVVETAAGDLRQVLPHIYQTSDDGSITTVTGSFKLDEGKVAIALGPYDRNRELVIDPALLWEHHFISRSLIPKAFAVDANGNVFIAGRMFDNYTSAGNDIAPVPPTISTKPGYGGSAFVMGISPAKTTIFATYLGFGDAKSMVLQTVSGSPALYVSGNADDDFPTTAGVYQPLSSGGGSFVAKLSTSGLLMWSTFLSGAVGSINLGYPNGTDTLNDIAADTSGNVYVTGEIKSPTFPVTLADFMDPSASKRAYVAKLSPDGTQLLYSTRLTDVPVALTVDEAGTAYAVSEAKCVVKVGTSGSILLRRCIPGQGYAGDIAIDSAHDIYIVGRWSGPDLPLTADAVSTLPGQPDAGYLLRYDSEVSLLKYGTYLGSKSSTQEPATYTFTVTIDAANRAIVGARGIRLPSVNGWSFVSDPYNRILRFGTSNTLEMSTGVTGALAGLATDGAGNIYALTQKAQSGASGQRAFIFVRKINSGPTDLLGLSQVEPTGIYSSAPTTITAFAEFGYFTSGMALNIGGVPGTFSTFGGGSPPTTAAFDPAAGMQGGLKSVTISSGGNTTTLENAIEVLADPPAITGLASWNTSSSTSMSWSASAPVVMHSADAGVTLFTISGTGFAPDAFFSIKTHTTPILEYQLATYRVDTHTIKAVIHQMYNNPQTGQYDVLMWIGSQIRARLDLALTVDGTVVSSPFAFGPTTGGTTIAFRQLEAANAVTSLTVDGLPATGFTTDGGSPAHVSALSPPHAGTGRVTISVLAPTGGYTFPNAFRYWTAISLDSLSPNTVPTAGGTAVTINGSGFLSGARLTMGNLLITPTSFSPTAITFTTPPSNPGGAYVTLRNPDGGWAQILLTYPGPTGVMFEGPTTGPAAGGTIITLHGDTLPSYTIAVGGLPAPLVTWNATTSDGTYRVAAHAAGVVDVVVLDVNGNTLTFRKAFRYTDPPIIDSFTPAGGTPGTTVIINGSKFTNAAFVTFGGVRDTSFIVNSPTQIVAHVPATGLTGPIAVTVGLDTGTSADTFYVAPRFASTPFSPATALPCDSITISGQNFQGVTAVSFNGTAATTFSPSGGGTWIDATVPTGATTGTVAVTGPGGTATSSVTFGVKPDVTSFTPTAGPAGTTVTITGARFTGATAVTFAGTPATSFSVVSSTSITAVSPLNSSGVICVTTPGGANCSSGTFRGAPKVNSFSPTGGIPGQTVTITGLSFTGATSVKFNGVSAPTFTVDTDTQITTTVPSGAATGPISVTTPNGTGTSASNFGMLPYISSFTPPSGGSGTAVTITGYAFTGATAVNFGTGNATFTVTNDTTISTVVPGTATTGTITVTTPAGTATSTGTFTVGATISGVSPNKWTGSTNAITITGNGFTGATAISFGGTAGTITSNSGTVITATIPGNPNTGYVTVTTPLGNGTSTVLFYGITTFSSYTPASAARGDMIVINGLNFTGTTAVAWGNPVVYSETPTITVLSNTQLRVQVPGFAQLGQVDIRVTTGYGDSTSTINPKFTVTDAAPPSLMAFRIDASGSIGMYWTGALMVYDILRSTSPAGPWTRIFPASTYVKGNYWVDSTITPGQVYYYKVFRLGTSPEQWSNIDWGTAFVFTDDPIVTGSTTLQAVHLTQIRQAVNMMRAAANLGAFSWAEPVGSGTPIKASHINELRTVLTQTSAAIPGWGTPTFTDPGTLTNANAIKAVHIGDLRYAVK